MEQVLRADRQAWQKLAEIVPSIKRTAAGDLPLDAAFPNLPNEGAISFTCCQPKAVIRTTNLQSLGKVVAKAEARKVTEELRGILTARKKSHLSCLMLSRTSRTSREPRAKGSACVGRTTLRIAVANMPVPAKHVGLAITSA